MKISKYSKSLLWLSPVLLVAGVVSFIVPNYITTNNKPSKTSQFNFTTNLNSVTYVPEGSNYLELSIDANHKLNKNVNYQWFYIDKLTKNNNNIYPIINHETANTQTLKIVDDIEKMHLSSLFCAIYDDENNYDISNITQIQKTNTKLQETNLSSLSIDRLVKNIPIWSRDFWNNSIYFESNNLINNSALFNNFYTLLGEFNIFKSIKKINSANDDLILEFTLNYNLEWTKSIYSNNVSKNKNFYVYDSKLYLFGIKLNDSHIISFDETKLRNYLSSLTLEEFNLKTTSENIENTLIEADCGFSSLDGIKSVNIQTNQENKTYSISIYLNENYYSSDLNKEIYFSDLLIEQEEKTIDINKLPIMNFMDLLMSRRYLEYQKIVEWWKRSNVYPKDEGYDLILNTLGIPKEYIYGSSTATFDCDLLNPESEKDKEFLMDYKNIDGINWSLPFKFQFYINRDVKVIGKSYTLRYYGENCWTDVKVDLNNTQYNYFTIQGNMVNVRPILTNSDSEKNEDYVINKYLIKILDNFFKFGWHNDFSKVYKLDENTTYIFDKDNDGKVETNNLNKTIFELNTTHPIVKQMFDEFSKGSNRELLPKNFIDKAYVEVYEKADSLNKNGAYINAYFVPTKDYLVFDFEKKTVNDVSLELIRQNGLNILKLENVFNNFVDIK